MSVCSTSTNWASVGSRRSSGGVPRPVQVGAHEARHVSPEADSDHVDGAQSGAVLLQRRPISHLMLAAPRFQSTTTTLPSALLSSSSVILCSHIGGEPVGRYPWMTKAVGLDQFTRGCAWDGSLWDSSVPQVPLSLV
ncbi:hypothetical protein EYF80_048714 [Liparis tanakae]|uniref:Uncharacterized protein n=1 Tax=Liparis tanakae TaxID=230148 RepID=A0A4Z2FIT7_9TELE|nr:hypothetical protein EYF80_048714 [Liparis tanakae]